VQSRFGCLLCALKIELNCKCLELGLGFWVQAALQSGSWGSRVTFSTESEYAAPDSVSASPPVARCQLPAFSCQLPVAGCQGANQPATATETQQQHQHSGNTHTGHPRHTHVGLSRLESFTGTVWGPANAFSSSRCTERNIKKNLHLRKISPVIKSDLRRYKPM